jgi:V/A-type H+-transporting ATPase subunit E
MSEYLNPNIKKLVTKLYDEGIGTANKQAQQIIADAQQQAAELLRKAKSQIAKMEEESLVEINHKKESLNSELKAALQQTLFNIKKTLAAVTTDKIMARYIGEALREKDFLQKIILTVLQKWSSLDNNYQLELLLSKRDEAELKDFFEQRIKQEFTFGLEVVIDDKIKTGFKIAVKNENYYVNFRDKEFEDFFKSFLRKKTLEWIYTNSENG